MEEKVEIAPEDRDVLEREKTIHTVRSVSAAHLVQSDPKSKCFRLHGHTWEFEIFITGPIAIDGMVLDFNDIKKIVDGVDHKVVIPANIINFPEARKKWPKKVREGDKRAGLKYMENVVVSTVCSDGVVKYYEFPNDEQHVGLAFQPPGGLNRTVVEIQCVPPFFGRTHCLNQSTVPFSLAR